MAVNLFIQNTYGGTALLTTVTWSSRTTAENGVTRVTTYTGKCTAFTIREELIKLKNIVTKDGMYKSHSLVEGNGDYDTITIIFHKLLRDLSYIYTYKGPTKSFPLESHPGYKSYWNNNIVYTADGNFTIEASNLDNLQAITDGNIDQSTYADIKFEKWSQANGKALIASASGTAASGWTRCDAKHRGQNSFIAPTVSVEETIYFKEFDATALKYLPVTIDVRIGAKEVAAMDGRAGYPRFGTFGLPKTVGDLLNDSYSEYQKTGVDKNGNDVSDINAAFFTDRGIPTTYPMWLCTSVNMKKVGNWFEATLTWLYSNYSVAPDLYPLATARVNGYI